VSDDLLALELELRERLAGVAEREREVERKLAEVETRLSARDDVQGEILRLHGVLDAEREAYRDREGAYIDEISAKAKRLRELARALDHYEERVTEERKKALALSAEVGRLKAQWAEAVRPKPPDPKLHETCQKTIEGLQTERRLLKDALMRASLEAKGWRQKYDLLVREIQATQRRRN